MKRTLEDLSIADLKALYELSKNRMEQLLTHTPNFDYWIGVSSESYAELIKRVEAIFGKP